MPNFTEQFADVVTRFPDRPAISMRGESGIGRITYAQLDAMARSAAVSLAARGVGPGDRCAMLAENSAGWCAAYLGILRLGAIAVPLDTAYNTSQVSKLLTDSGARCVVASARFIGTATSAAQPSCFVQPLDQMTTPRTGADVPPSQAGAADPAVILYTSGTTADPKGVVLTHGNLLAEKDAAFQVIPVNEDDAILGVLPLFHALAQMANLLLPLSLGAHVVFLESMNTRELMRALDEERISAFCCVPQFFYLIHQRVTGEVARAGVVRRGIFRLLLSANAALRGAGLNAGPTLFAKVHRALGPRMRLLITGGSKFDEAIGRDLYALGFTILQAYGLTETSGAATVTRPGEPIGTVGRPLPGVEIRIAPSGAEDIDGEILIRGPVVMAGYWNRPDATAAVLRDGWFHTGDLGRLDSQGRLTITGRSKEVIVLSSGKNIYPEEIETHYRQSPFIKELGVIGITDASEPTAERLHAIVVPDIDLLRDRRIVNVGELIRFELEGLSVSLPGYKRVLGFDIRMEPLPRTTTLKLKRHEILRSYTDGTRTSHGAESGSGVPAPETLAPHVQRVVDAVRAVLGKPIPVGADSNFELDLGLDSMERVELLAALERRLGVRVSEDIAQRAFTVGELAEAFAVVPAAGQFEPSAPGPGGGSELDGSRPSPTGNWESVLQDTTLSADQQRSLLRRKPVTAIVTFGLARVLVRVLMRPRVTGIEQLPEKGPYIICPNHQSYLDPMALAAVLPFGVFRQTFFVGAAEYFQSPFTARLASLLNVVPVDPDANLLPALRAGAFGLREGKVLVLFPEGERSIDGTVRKFKKGAGILSEHLRVPIVPVAIDGMFEIWPRNRPLAWRRLLPWSGHHVRIAVGAPLAPRDHERLRDAVAGMWDEIHRASRSDPPAMRL